MSLKDYMQENRGRIDALLEKHINNLPDTVDPKLKAAMRHGLLLGGKRVRPFLVFVTGKLLGADEKVLEGPAAAIECIHAYSLIHDDLPAMDNDVLRRGQPPSTRPSARPWASLRATRCRPSGLRSSRTIPSPKGSSRIRSECFRS